MVASMEELVPLLKIVIFYWLIGATIGAIAWVSVAIYLWRHAKKGLK